MLEISATDGELVELICKGRTIAEAVRSIRMQGNSFNLRQQFQRVFYLDLSDVKAITAWNFGASVEVNDERINELLLPSIVSSQS